MSDSDQNKYPVINIETAPTMSASRSNSKNKFDSYKTVGINEYFRYREDNQFTWFGSRNFQNELEVAKKLRERNLFIKENYRAQIQKYGIFDLIGDYVIAYNGPEVKEHLDAHGHPTDVFEYNATTDTLAREKWGDNARKVRIYLGCIKAILHDGQVLVYSMAERV